MAPHISQLFTAIHKGEIMQETNIKKPEYSFLSARVTLEEKAFIQTYAQEQHASLSQFIEGALLYLCRELDQSPHYNFLDYYQAGESHFIEILETPVKTN